MAKRTVKSEEPDKTSPRRVIRKKPVAPAAVSVDRVAERAYELFVERGRHHGDDVEHWLEAERELGSAARTTKKRGRQPPR